jgi:hypothetical protein
MLKFPPREVETLTVELTLLSPTPGIAVEASALYTNDRGHYANCKCAEYHARSVNEAMMYVRNTYLASEAHNRRQAKKRARQRVMSKNREQ